MRWAIVLFCMVLSLGSGVPAQAIVSEIFGGASSKALILEPNCGDPASLQLVLEDTINGPKEWDSLDCSFNFDRCFIGKQLFPFVTYSGFDPANYHRRFQNLDQIAIRSTPMIMERQYSTGEPTVVIQSGTDYNTLSLLGSETCSDASLLCIVPTDMVSTEHPLLSDRFGTPITAVNREQTLIPRRAGIWRIPLPDGVIGDDLGTNRVKMFDWNNLTTPVGSLAYDPILDRIYYVFELFGSPSIAQVNYVDSVSIPNVGSPTFTMVSNGSISVGGVVAKIPRGFDVNANELVGDALFVMDNKGFIYKVRIALDGTLTLVTTKDTGLGTGTTNGILRFDEAKEELWVCTSGVIQVYDANLNLDRSVSTACVDLAHDPLNEKVYIVDSTRTLKRINGNTLVTEDSVTIPDVFQVRRVRHDFWKQKLFVLQSDPFTSNSGRFRRYDTCSAF